MMPVSSSMLRAILCSVAVTAAATSAAAQQRVLGTVLQPDSITPAAQVLVEWRSRHSTPQRLLTDRAGRFVLVLPSADSVYLRILRPGYRPQALAGLAIAAGATVSTRIVLADRPVVLSSVRVQGESACAGRSDAAAWTLLEQARTAILAAELAERDPQLSISAVAFEGDATPGGAIVLRDSSIHRSGRLAEPSRAQRDSIFRFGYVRRTSDTSVYHAPTPDVLVDERFRVRYCVALVARDSTPDGLIGVRFQPVRRPGPGIADVFGTFWLDANRYLLSRVEFEYVNVPPHHYTPGLGGYLEFAVLGTGHWLLREWLFRMPNLVWVRGERQSLQRPDGSYPLDRSGAPIRWATPDRGARGLWAQGRIVYDVRVAGESVYSDTTAAQLTARIIPPR